jgi:D-glycero-D-manno-heptose 1,7-bisphosphate phosphatase
MLEVLEPGIILDRDGTLVDLVRDEDSGTVIPAFHPSHLRFMPGVQEGLRALRDGGFRLCIATNQPGPAKGQYSVEAVTRTNQALVAEIAALGVSIAALEVCVHHPTGGPGGDPKLVGPCACRKPQPGMLEQAMRRASLDPARYATARRKVPKSSARLSTPSCAASSLRRRCERFTRARPV